jgi:hypothetical protein
MSRIAQPLRHDVDDAPECWESPVDAEIATRSVCGLPNRPYAPLAWEEVPDGAAGALERACGAWRLDQLFVIPPAARPAARGTDWLWAPTQVLGLADRGVALWVDTEPVPGVQLVVALDDLAAIERIQLGLQVRLTVLARDRSLAVHYSALAAPELEPALAAVRAAVCGYPGMIGDEPPPPMPPNWAHVARSLAVRLRAGDPALLRFRRAFGEVDSSGDTLLAFTPGELVIAREPDPEPFGPTGAWGPDLLHVPRTCLEGADRMDTGVRLLVRGVQLEVPLTRSITDDLLDLVEDAISKHEGM